MPDDITGKRRVSAVGLTARDVPSPSSVDRVPAAEPSCRVIAGFGLFWLRITHATD